MRRPLPPRSRGFELNLTPLIDVVFNLVIFFLVASHFAGTEPAEAVNLPGASQSEDDSAARRLTITVKEDGTYLIGTRPVTLGEVEGAIEHEVAGNPQQCAVRLRGDRAAPFQLIEPIMVACARNGVLDFGFKVIDEINEAPARGASE